MRGAKHVSLGERTVRLHLVMLFLVAAAGSRLSAQEPVIVMKAPHIHAYSKATITFNVTGSQDGKGIKGLMPILSILKQGEDAVSEVTMESGELQDMGNGDYNWTRTFPGVGLYALQFSVETGKQTASRAFPLELTKPGGERIFKPSKEKAVYNYQIRWTAAPALPWMGEKTTFDIELKRTVGEIANPETPWTSTFEHLLPANLKKDSLAVLLESAEGKPVKDLTSTLEYRGLGIYRVSAEIPAPMSMAREAETYRLHVRFTDDANYSIDETGADYAIAVRKPEAGSSPATGMAAGMNGFAAELLFAAGQAKTGSNDLTVRIADKAGKPVDADKVTLVAEMDPASSMSMDMSKVKPITMHLDKASGTQAAPGEYRTKIRFPYDGVWLIGLTFTASGLESRVDNRVEVTRFTGSSGIVIGGVGGGILLFLIIGILRKLLLARKQSA